MVVSYWTCFWMEVIGVLERMDKVWIPLLWMLPHSSLLGSCWSLTEGQVPKRGIHVCLDVHNPIQRDHIHMDW